MRDISKVFVILGALLLIGFLVVAFSGSQQSVAPVPNQTIQNSTQATPATAEPANTTTQAPAPVKATPAKTTTSAPSGTASSVCPVCGHVGEYQSMTDDGTGTAYYCSYCQAMFISYPDDGVKTYETTADYNEYGTAAMLTFNWVPS
jgi:hypothetical protein